LSITIKVCLDRSGAVKMLRPRVEGFAKEALGNHPDLLARLLG
jgi:hypothetical protein